MNRFKRFLSLTLAALLTFPALALPQQAQHSTLRIPLFVNYDLDVPTETADADQVVTVVNLTNTSFTIAASPDVCREVVVVIVDTTPSITAGTVTVTGTDCNGDALVWPIDVSGGAGTYNSIAPSENGNPRWFFATVTDVTAAGVATLGGGGDETITVGTGANLPGQSCVTLGSIDGTVTRLDANADWIPGNAKVVTSGASNTISGVNASEDAFLHVNVGDVIRIDNRDSFRNGEDRFIERVVATNADDDTVTINGPPVQLDATATGYSYSWRQLACGQGDDNGKFSVRNASTVTVSIFADYFGVGTNLDFRLFCGPNGAVYIPVPVVTVLDVTQFNYSASMTVTGPYDFCKLDMVIDGADDASDAVIEVLSAYATIRY